MLPIRWILAPVALVFAIALLPRAYVAQRSPTVSKVTVDLNGLPKLQDRFVPGADQQDQLASLSEGAAHKLSVGLANIENENDPTSAVQPMTSPPPKDDGKASLAMEHPEDGASVVSHQVKPKRERRIGTADNNVRRFAQLKTGKQSAKQTNTKTGGESTGQIPEPNFTFSAY